MIRFHVRGAKTVASVHHEVLIKKQMSHISPCPMILQDPYDKSTNPQVGAGGRASWMGHVSVKQKNTTVTDSPFEIKALLQALQACSSD